MPLNLQPHVEKLREAGALAREAGLQVDLGIVETDANTHSHELRILLKAHPKAGNKAALVGEPRAMKTVSHLNTALNSLHQHLQANRERQSPFGIGYFDWKTIHPAEANVVTVCNQRMPLTKQEATALRALLEK